MSETNIFHLVILYDRLGQKAAVIVTPTPKETIEGERQKLGVLFEYFSTPFKTASKRLAYALRTAAYDLLLDSKGREFKPPKIVGNIPENRLTSLVSILSEGKDILLEDELEKLKK